MFETISTSTGYFVSCFYLPISCTSLRKYFSICFPNIFVFASSPCTSLILILILMGSRHGQECGHKTHTDRYEKDDKEERSTELVAILIRT